jgi:hypothetical protein
MYNKRNQVWRKKEEPSTKKRAFELAVKKEFQNLKEAYDLQNENNSKKFQKMDKRIEELESKVQKKENPQQKKVVRNRSAWDIPELKPTHDYSEKAAQILIRDYQLMKGWDPHIRAISVGATFDPHLLNYALKQAREAVKSNFSSTAPSYVPPKEIVFHVYLDHFDTSTNYGSIPEKHEGYSIKLKSYRNFEPKVLHDLSNLLPHEWEDATTCYTPLKSGCCIGELQNNSRGSLGTMGLAWVGKEGKAYVITCAHVVEHLQQVFQSPVKTVLAKFTRNSARGISESPPKGWNSRKQSTADFAAIEVEDIDDSAGLCVGPYRVSSFKDPAEGDVVYKYGSRTGLTSGVVTDTHHKDDSGPTVLEDHFHIRSSGQGEQVGEEVDSIVWGDFGDSGSAIFTKNPDGTLTLVGLFRGGPSDSATEGVGCKISNILPFSYSLFWARRTSW